MGGNGQTSDRAGGDLIDEDMLDSIAQAPISISPDLAARYIEVAKFIASVPEKDAIAMFVPAEDDPRLDELRQFLSFIFIGWRTNAPFYFFPKMRDEIRSLHRHRYQDGTYPECLFGRPTCFENRQGWLEPKMIFCHYTSCGRGKNGDFRSLRRQMGKLLLLNALGYDIYGCPNPILYRNRMQRTIPWIVNLVAESDDATIKDQKECVRRMAGKVGAVVFSGRRSYHQYFRLAAPIRNPHAVTPEQLDRRMPPGAMAGGRPWTRWHLVMALKRSNELATIPVEPFRYAADLLRGLILERAGVQLCPDTLFNFSCLARVPGFAHAGSGERSELFSVDPKAVYSTSSLGEPDDVRYSPVWREILGIPTEDVFPKKHKERSVPPGGSHNGISDPDGDSETEKGTEKGTKDEPKDPDQASVSYIGPPISSGTTLVAKQWSRTS